MAIRYDRKLKENIESVVRRFNAKVSRLNRLDKELVPPKIKKEELYSFSRRKDLTRRLKELDRFTKRGAEEVLTLKSGSRLQKWEYINYKKNLATARRIASREVREYGNITPSSLGKIQSYSFREMGDDWYLKLLGRREKLETNIEELTREELKSYSKFISYIISSDRRDIIFRESYYQRLFDIGNTVGVSSDLMEELRRKMDKLTDSEFYKIYNTEIVFKEINYYYISVTKLKTDPENVYDDVLTLYEGLNDFLDTKV